MHYLHRFSSVFLITPPPSSAVILQEMQRFLFEITKAISRLPTIACSLDTYYPRFSGIMVMEPPKMTLAQETMLNLGNQKVRHSLWQPDPPSDTPLCSPAHGIHCRD
ncbi:hypothetical protein G7K_2201-t1 [Saitoella complicata NRRL Y-17804]|uniref:Uncharacterized protein n=1 Tax=Saitoella complicata (strain BCRC 22490 / CBS 7301 / JCM 7358 / NBRC 10748 / NRRL Y-17804) TaxID=698492 RepID=A0A0E9NDX9_SAICN|nr:hypothetical protein G7K_2201-t1 [Saitoella complicata NRRL Y-17804]